VKDLLNYISIRMIRLQQGARRPARDFRLSNNVTAGRQQNGLL